MDLWLPGAWLEEGLTKRGKGYHGQYMEVLLQLDSVGGYIAVSVYQKSYNYTLKRVNSVVYKLFLN